MGDKGGIALVPIALIRPPAADEQFVTKFQRVPRAKM
jgi:hypothetical protein